MQRKRATTFIILQWTDTLFNIKYKHLIIIICPTAIAHSMGQIIKSFCVCPSVDTLTVAFLCRFSPNWTQTSKPPKVKTSSLRSISPHPFSYFPPINPQFCGVNRRFQATLAKSKNVHIIKTTASIPTKFCTVIKTTKCPSWVVSTHALQIQDGGRPPSWKNRKIAISQPWFERF